MMQVNLNIEWKVAVLGQKTIWMKLIGIQNIVAKPIALSFEQCKHLISTVDCQLPF
jgi:hypothetical protein